MQKPFDGTYQITREFGVKAPEYAGYPDSRHPGVDFGLPADTPLKAAIDGVITVIDRPANVKVGRGKEVVVTNGPVSFHTCHMNRVDVKTGQMVKSGQPIGLSGYTGYVVDYQGKVGTPAGAHLHFEKKVNGVYTDPLEEDVNKFTPAQINQLFVIAFNRQANGTEKKRLGAMSATDVLNELDNNNRAFRGKASQYDALKAQYEALQNQNTETLWNKVKAAFGRDK